MCVIKNKQRKPTPKYSVIHNYVSQITRIMFSQKERIFASCIVSKYQKDLSPDNSITSVSCIKKVSFSVTYFQGQGASVGMATSQLINFWRKKHQRECLFYVIPCLFLCKSARFFFFFFLKLYYSLSLYRTIEDLKICNATR